MSQDEQLKALGAAHKRLARIKEIQFEMEHGDKTHFNEFTTLWKEHFDSYNLSRVCPACGKPY